MIRRTCFVLGFLALVTQPLALQKQALGQSPERAVEEPPLTIERPAAKTDSVKIAKAALPAKKPVAAAQDPAPLPMESPAEPANAAAPFGLPAAGAGADTAGDSPFEEIPALPAGKAATTDAESNPLGVDASPAPPIKKHPALQTVDPRDAQVERTQAAGRPLAAETNTRPAAITTQPTGAGVSDITLLPTERLATGPSQVHVAVEVRSPEVANLHVDNIFYVRLKNVGQENAAGVTVRYPLPENAEFVDADPAVARSEGRVYFWQFSNMASGTERTIKVKVKPTAKGSFDHAVTVSVVGGGRARTMVRSPELKLEIRADKTKPLKGTPVNFDITITNTGDHPARDVEIQAKLTPGLSHPKGSELALKLKQEMGIATIEPGQSVPLKLAVDTKGMGKQTVDLSASTLDIPAPVTARAEIEVVSPDLQVAVEGPSERYPDNIANYKITVSNKGTAPASAVTVAAQIPTSGQAESVQPKARWAPEARTYYWMINELPPGASEVFNVQVRMGAIGLFTLRTGAKAQGVQPVQKTHNTDIKGLSKLAMTVNEPRGALDEGEESSYEITVRNEGSKEAERIQVRGIVSDNLQILSVTDASGVGGNQPAADPQAALFQQIDRLPSGAKVTMSFRVRAIKAGNGTCTVTAVHDDIPVPISQSMLTRVLSR